MSQEWEYSAKSVTKYNPAFRNEEGHFIKEEWIGFFQLGDVVGGELLTYDEYLKVEDRYVSAAKLFFSFNNCSRVILRNLEKQEVDDFSFYFPNDEKGHIETYTAAKEGAIVSGGDIDNIIRLILREVVWAELICETDELSAVRFGYDFYMYFNSPVGWDALRTGIAEIGLFVY